MGWVGSRSWRKAVAEVAVGGENGIIRSIDRKIPTYDEAVQLIKDAGGTVTRVDPSHAGSKVAQKIDFPHIN